MSQKQQENYLLIVKEKFEGVFKEARNLTMPTLKETLIKTIVIMIICGLMTGFLIIIGEIVIKLFALII